MPFLFLIVGIGLIVTAVRGTHKDALALLADEMSGAQSFLVWAMAIFILGGVGYVPVVRPVARGLLGLVLLVIFLKDGGGFFSKFAAQIKAPECPGANGGAGAPSSVGTPASPGAVKQNGGCMPPMSPMFKADGSFGGCTMTIRPAQ